MNGRLLEVRKEFGLSQEQIGKRLGVTRSSISNMETGRFSITDTMVKLICSEFDISEHWFRTGEGQMLEYKTQQEVMASAMGHFMKVDNPVKNEILLMLMQSLESMTEEQFAPIMTHMTNIATLLKDKEGKDKDNK